MSAPQCIYTYNFLVNLRKIRQPYIFWTIFFFFGGGGVGGEEETGKILLQPYKLYLVLTCSQASTSKTMWEEKQGCNSHPFEKNPVERKPTVFSAHVACCIQLERPWLWFLFFRPWHICPQPGSFAQARHWAVTWNRNKVWSAKCIGWWSFFLFVGLLFLISVCFWTCIAKINRL